MLSFLQSVTALIGLDKLSSGFAGGKALARRPLSRVEQARKRSGAALQALRSTKTQADDLP
jgi:hypothetical protein